jgi:hypothetical protein
LITALDSRTNKQVWQKEVPYLAGFGSGVLATGGGLIFHGGSDGYFRAYDSKTGEELWRFQTGFERRAIRCHRRRRKPRRIKGSQGRSGLGFQDRRQGESVERTSRSAHHGHQRDGSRHRSGTAKRIATIIKECPFPPTST